MADTKISALTAATSALAADEFPVNEAGTTKKVTLTQLLALVGDTLQNASTTTQSISGTTAYVTNSNIAVPVGKLRIGTVFHWRLVITKTAAGTTAGCAFLVKIGTAGTTGDATILTFTLTGTPTGAVDTAFVDIEIIIRGPLSGSCITAGGIRFSHNLASTGFSSLPSEELQAVSSGFDATVANLIVGLTITTTSLSVWSVVTCSAEAKSL